MPLICNGHGFSANMAMDRDFQYALKLLNAFKNDSAHQVLCRILDELSAKNELNSPFALQVRLRDAEALEKAHQDEKAIHQLLHLTEDAKVQRQWDVLSNAHLSLARLHEKMDRMRPCHVALKRAAHFIKSHKLAKIYPRLCIRQASYYRIFGNKDSAMFFAQEVIRTAPKIGLFEDLAVGNLLMGLLLWDKNVPKTVSYFRAAGKQWKKIEDYSGYQAVMSNLSRLFLAIGMNKEALLYNDSSLYAAHLAGKNGNQEEQMYFINLRDRAQIFELQGQYDSALFYLKKGTELELSHLKQSNHEKIVEIDARYNYEKNTQQLKEQEQLLTYEKERREILIRLIIFGLFCLGVITYYYLSLKQANKKMKVQAADIRRVNKDLSNALQHQIDLQGEVHHRVKNNLQLIIGLLELQKAEIKNPLALQNMEAMSNRIFSMAAIHDLLYQKLGSELIRFEEYASSLCKHFQEMSGYTKLTRFNISEGEHIFNIDTLMPLGIILNELLTNSIKYAGGHTEQLEVDIKIEEQANGFKLFYADNGPGFPEGTLAAREGGLGSYLLRSMTKQLQGTMASRNENGAVFELFFQEKNNR
ncbi:MAG: histidine kinase dimerization/phosphoacceptor domain -containing protein [Bacteroidota bacterium]